MELTISHLQHYDLKTLRFAVPKPYEGIRQIIKISPVFDSVEDTSGHTWSIKYIAPLLLPLSALYEEIDGEIGIVQLINILSGADTSDIQKARIVKEECKYKVLYNSILDKDILFSVSLEYNEGKWSYYWNGYSAEFDQLALFDYLFSHHYDVFSLIPQNLAIDKRSVK